MARAATTVQARPKVMCLLLGGRGWRPRRERGMPNGLDEREQTTRCHDPGPPRRWVVRAHGVLEELPPGLRCVDLELKLDAAAVVQDDADAARGDEQHHEPPQRA